MRDADSVRVDTSSDSVALPVPDIARVVRHAVALLLALATPWWPTIELGAAIHVCRAADGTTVFQDRPCARTALALADDPRAPRPPAGMHPSWFEPPSGTRARARCDESGCVCDTLSRPFDNGLALALADALYIDGAWHRYELHRNAAGGIAGTGTDEAREPHREFVEAACDVLMSQQTLRRYTERVFGELRSRERAAEVRGFDRPTPCDDGNADACAYHHDVLLYRRMLTDLGALQLPREAPAAIGSL